MNMARILMLGGLTASLAIPAIAQTTPGATPTAQPPAAAQPSSDSVVVPASGLEAGANSYTEGQTRSRMEENGFSGITNLRKDDNGFWRATATHGGTSGEVAMDFRGRIAHGAGVATIGPRPAATGTTGSTGATRSAPDGTPGNPPGTAAGRAVDRTLGNPPTAPDGTPGNPPGTAAGRAVDRTLGTTPPTTNPAPIQR